MKLALAVSQLSVFRPAVVCVVLMAEAFAEGLESVKQRLLVKSVRRPNQLMVARWMPVVSSLPR